MKKIFALAIAALLFAVQLSAQKPLFEKGDKALNIGIGLGSTYYSSYYTSRAPAISASFEYGVADQIIDKGSIGVGGYVGYASAKYEDWWKTTNIIIGARGVFHYPLIEKLDTYTGLMLGYNVVNVKYTGSYSGLYSASGSGLASAWFLGARYYFNEKISGMAELGYGISVLTIGVGIKL